MRPVDRELLGPGAFLFGIGIWAIGVTIETFVPPVFIASVGVLCLIAGSCLTAAAYLPDPVIQNTPLSPIRQWIRRGKPQVSKEGFPDWPVRELYYYVRPDAIEEVDGVGNWKAAEAELIDAFGLGKLRVWGRRYVDQPFDVHRPPELIPPEYWRGTMLTSNALIEGSNEPHTYPQQGQSRCFDLQVSKAEAMAVWPSVHRQPANENKPQRWPLCDLLAYLQPDLKPFSSQQRWLAAVKAVEDEFSTGGLAVWGRKQLSGPGSPALERISTAYWADADLMVGRCVDPATQRSRQTQRRSFKTEWEYGDLHVDRASAMKIWPTPLPPVPKDASA